MTEMESRDEPLVTIGIASYNNAKYIRETLESIRQQTYTNIELIIVDDDSTDNSVQVIKQWMHSYPKFNSQLILHQSNRGVCAVCNTVLSNAKGEYLSIVGSDDVFLPEKTNRQLAELREAGSEYAVLYSDMYIINETGERSSYTQLRSLEPGFMKCEGNIFELEIVQNRINAPSAMTVTQYVRDTGGYDEDLVFEDWDMWLRLTKMYKVKYSSFISVEYRQLASSLWNSKSKAFYESSIQCLVKHLGFSEKTDFLIKKGISDYAQLLYKLYGRDANRWLKLAYDQDRSIKMKVLLLFSELGVPYGVYNMITRIMNRNKF